MTIDSQLEFDLVSPLLGDPTPRQVARLAVKANLPLPKTAEDVDDLRGFAARIHHLDLVYDERSFSLNDELQEIRVLIGPADWQRDEKLWTRRARKDPKRLRKIILSLKKHWKLF